MTTIVIENRRDQSMEEYIARREAGEQWYDAYLGFFRGKHWFRDSVQGTRWAWEDQSV